MMGHGPANLTWSLSVRKALQARTGVFAETVSCAYSAGVEARMDLPDVDVDCVMKA
jgi:hypothetical protein